MRYREIKDGKSKIGKDYCILYFTQDNNDIKQNQANINIDEKKLLTFLNTIKQYCIENNKTKIAIINFDSSWIKIKEFIINTFEDTDIEICISYKENI